MRRWRDGQVVKEHRLSLNIEQRYVAVVAARVIRRGQTITSHDLEMREVVLDQARGEVITDMSAVIGKVAAGTIRKGDVLTDGTAQRPYSNRLEPSARSGRVAVLLPGSMPPLPQLRLSDTTERVACS